MALSVEWDSPLKTLDIRGPRGALTKEKAVELVASITSGAETDFERVILSTWAFSEESAKVVADAMKALPGLKSVVLADIIAGRPEVEGLAVYRILGEVLKDIPLLEIDLSDNAVGPKGVEACRDLLSGQKELERLFFCNCGISAEAARSIADVVLFRTPTNFKVIHFDNNMSGGGGAIAVADIVSASPNLTDFRFSSSRGTRDGGAALAIAFRQCPGIRKINLHDNLWAVPTGIEMGTTLRSLRHLTHLDIGDILLKDEGMEALTSGLVRGCAHSLLHLDVSANELTAEGAKHLGRCVRRLTRLQSLHAQENEMEDEGVEFVARAIERRRAFKTLAASKGSLASPSFAAGAARVSEGTDTECDAAAVDSLIEINLAENMMLNIGAKILAVACGKHLKGLKKLDISGNDLTSRGVNAVRSALESGGINTDDVLAPMDDEEGGDDDEDEAEEEAAEAGEAAAGADEEDSDLEEEASAAAGAAEGEKADAAVDAVAAAMLQKFEI